MERDNNPDVLSWVKEGLDSIVLGLAANTIGITAASTMVDRLHLQSPVANAIAGGLTALALVPLNYGISALTSMLSENDLKDRIKWYGGVAAVTALLTGAGISIYVGLSDLITPPKPIQKPAVITPIKQPTLTLEEKEKLGLQEIYTKYQEAIDQASEIYNVPASLIVANIYVESRGDPKAVSCTGAAGLMQLAVDTAKDVGVKTGDYELVKDPTFKCNKKTGWQSTRKRCNAVDSSECDYVNDKRFDPDQNILGGASNLNEKFKKRGNWKGALTDNAGGDTTYYAKVWGYKEKFEAQKKP